MTSVSTKTRCPLFPSLRPNSGHRALRICAGSERTHSITSSAVARSVSSRSCRLGRRRRRALRFRIDTLRRAAPCHVSAPARCGRRRRRLARRCGVDRSRRQRTVGLLIASQSRSKFSGPRSQDHDRRAINRDNSNIPRFRWVRSPSGGPTDRTSRDARIKRLEIVVQDLVLLPGAEGRTDGGGVMPERTRVSGRSTSLVASRKRNTKPHVAPPNPFSNEIAAPDIEAAAKASAESAV
jgi:hypothetical protein